MEWTDFINSFGEDSAPVTASRFLQILWWEKKGDWVRAHDMLQDAEDPASCHLHAYLHRREGDLWNADYWYRKAGEKQPQLSLDEEWRQLAVKFLKNMK
jgi:hypothetical protein